ncbi:MAG: FG-GAP repeat protein, partial [Planctomycetes bacterium]|nr:FG-GAP repeat protein [Planctomycetota bacterium]
MRNCQFAVLLVSAPVFAQVELYVVNGAATVDRLGASVCAVGDVDADGYGDLAIGAPGSDAFAPNAGQVLVISGRTRQTIRTWSGSAASQFFGTSLAACGDLNADGHADVVVAGTGRSGGPNGSVVVRSGASGAVLRSWSGAPGFGAALAANGDVTGDGVSDVLVGNANIGNVWVFNGASGALVRQHVKFFDFGYALAYVGDVDADGRAEYAVGSPESYGGVLVYSGGTGAQLWVAFGALGEQLGVSMTGIADLTGDGRPELVVGAGDNGSFGVDARGYFRVFDGTNGAVVDTVNGADFDDQLGATLAAADDLDGDGQQDFVVAHYWPNPDGAVQVRRGSDRSILASVPPPAAGIAWGDSLSFGDVSGDGLADVVIGAPFAAPNGAYSGAVHVYSVVRAPKTFCQSETNSLGCTPAIAWSGLCSASSPAVFDVGASSVLNNKPGLLFYGFKPRQTPFQGGHMCVVAPTQRTAVQNSGGTAAPTNDCSGAFHYDLNARIQSGVDPQLAVGEEVFAQYWSRDPADAST